jgi:proteasome accessory factor C
VSAGAGTTAEAVLQRLLLVLPLAVRAEGAKVDELAEELEVPPRRLLRDLRELESRSYYLPAGLGDQIQLTVTRERLEAWTSGEFQRPVRLTPREALALELALRVVRGGSSPFDELREQLVAALRSPPPEEAEDPAVALGGAEAVSDPIRARVEEATRERRELRIVYRAPGREPERRRVGPLLLAHAEGRWYLLVRDLERGGHRAFRLDRTLEAVETGAPFTAAPEDEAAVEGFIQEGRIHDGGGPDAPEPFEAVVDYSPRIARWIAERGWERAEELEDGGIRVRHRVLDPEWLVRHVLSYGAEARVVEPEWASERVVAVLTSPPLASSDPRG